MTEEPDVGKLEEDKLDEKERDPGDAPLEEDEEAGALDDGMRLDEGLDSGRLDGGKAA